MIKRWGTIGTLIFAVALSSCFKSDQPLISVFESQAPVAAGVYTYTEDGETKQIAVSIDWPATVTTSGKSDGSLEVDRYYMREVRQGYYIVMDKSSNYGLIRVDDGQVVLYNSGDACDKLQDFGEAPEETEYEYNVEIADGDPSTCKFSAFNDLARAFNDLIEANTLTVSRTYERQQ